MQDMCFACSLLEACACSERFAVCWASQSCPWLHAMQLPCSASGACIAHSRGLHKCAACRPVRNIQAACNAERMQRPWSLQERMQQYAADELRRQRNKAAAAEGRQPELFWRSLYLPEQGMFCEAPKDLQLGTRQKVCALLSVLAPGDLQMGSDVAAGWQAEGAVADSTLKHAARDQAQGCSNAATALQLQL